MRRILLSLSLLLLSGSALAAMQSKAVDWKVGKQAFSGFIVYDDASKQQRPGLLMVPDWMGVTPDAVAKARQMAGTDYVVLLVDMYGKRVRPKTPAAAKAQVTKLYADRTALRARATAALEVLKKQAGKVPLDVSRIGAFGYCFGGATVLELARTGADLAGVVTFHGGLGTSLPAQSGVVKASLLVLNGADDEGTQGDIEGFQREMTAAGVDWQFVNFSQTVHCFALESANSPPGCVYSARSATRANLMMRNFFVERFAAP